MADARRAAQRGRPFLVAGCVAGLVFTVFVAYAFLTRATYRTTALVEVEPIGAAPAAPPAPLEAGRRLREAVLVRDVLARLAKELAPSGDAQDAAASRIRDALQIDTIDSRVFSVSYKDSDPAQAQRLCNLLARQAAERAPRALLPARSADERQQESERDQRAADVVAFLAAHPEVALQAAPSASGSPAAPPKEDAALSALRTERARLAQRLEALSATSDNPYAEPEDSTLPPEQIKRRIAEIDGVVASRRRAMEQPGARAAAPSAFDEQWRKMLQGLAELPAATPIATAIDSFKGRVASEAPLPDSPIEPNRPLVLFLGFLAALGSAGLIIIARAVGQRRGPSRHSSRSGNVTERLPAVRQASVAPSMTPPPLPVTEMRALPPSSPPPAFDAGSGNGASGSSAPEPAPSPFAATIEAAVAPAPEPAPRPTNSILPHAVIEINAPDRGSRGEQAPTAQAAAPAAPAPAADNGRRPAKRAATRVTQVLGSPIAPGNSDELGSDPPPAHGNVPPAPATERGLPRIDSDGRGYDAQPAYAAEVVGASPAGQRRAQSAERSTALARVEPAPQVLTYDVSTGWHPDPSLDVSLRYSLRDEIVAHYQGRCFVVGVSAGPDLSEQKSRLSVELALALAERERTRVLILEADFQRPSVHRLARAKLPLGSGFSQQLHLRSNAGPAMASVPSQWMVARCHARLDVLGESAMRAPGLMATPKFETCISELRRFYDFIVVDGPPLSMADESRVLDRLVDGMLFFSTGSNDPAMARLSTLFSGKVFSKVVKRG
ncbi:MAG TPA: hypothetical protein VG937_05540 [Polyangiaceae bacterium]|nr:hypothetical protein [Polyangiaceae bacterium]